MSDTSDVEPPAEPPRSVDERPSIAASEIPEVREEARQWLIENNISDQRTILAFGGVLVVLGLVLQAPWALVLAGCILLVLPFRWAAAPYFEAGDLRRGVIWANLGSWFLLFPMVIIVPDALPIAIANVIGPTILAATYLDRETVRRLVPVNVLIAVAVAWIGLGTDGVGLDDVAPRPVYLGVILAYLAVVIWQVMADIQEANRVHERSMQWAARANQELRDADRALRESRRRLLVAADQERVRLERDLHDGAQQRLVALSLQLRLAAELAEDGEPPTAPSLFAMHQAAAEALEELRDLAQGVYPARLHELGLARALHAVARRSTVPIEVDDRTTAAIDTSIQVALYFVCLEAIQNATKHGTPDTAITVSLTDDDDELVVVVADDGPGFDADRHTHSRGLLNMADRVGALGGALSIDAEPGVGTAVTARLPHASAEPEVVLR
ncbi:MAG: sensor histidine kinase [Acidimicrobiales bacterium]